jgi:hypothetical protein
METCSAVEVDQNWSNTFQLPAPRDEDEGREREERGPTQDAHERVRSKRMLWRKINLKIFG